MGLFNNELLNVIEWNEVNDSTIFWKWPNEEIKKNSRLIIRPGQDAIFLNNGIIEGIFTEEGNYQIDTDILPFLSTLKGFKYGFKSGFKAEVIFINTKEFQVRWGTRNPINIKYPNMPGGLPIRAFGSFSVRVSDYTLLIDKIAGVKNQFTVDDVKNRVLTVLDQLLMKWITKEGKDVFNLQANSYEISQGLKMDLDMEMIKIGLTIENFSIESFNYPESVQKYIEKNAAYNMVGDINKYQQVSMTETMEKNPSSTMSNMAQAGIGMQMGFEMINKFKNSSENNNLAKCKKCNEFINKDSKFCSKCGTKDPFNINNDFIFCSECGAKVNKGSKFCSECGQKL